MRRAAAAVRPERFEDLAALLALDRPLAIDVLGRYGRAKRAPDQVDYPDERLEPILSSTYGVPLYQEQIMETLVRLGGVTAVEANQARKALAKKQRLAWLKVYYPFEFLAALEADNRWYVGLGVSKWPNALRSTGAA